jgi:hypothetical protein
MRFFHVLIISVCFIFYGNSTYAQKDCDPTLREYVYNKEWLRLKKDCLTVKGTIYTAKHEEDGNVNIRISLDEGQEHLVNDKNRSEQFGCLLAVPICVGSVTYPDAIDACEGFVNKIKIPKNGTHVRVTGTYVLNFQHGWYEIHPVSSIEIIP